MSRSRIKLLFFIASVFCLFGFNRTTVNTPKPMNPGQSELASLPEEGGLRLHVETDKKEADIDEPIHITYTLYARQGVRYEGFDKEPRFRGFWSENFITPDKVRRGVVRIQGVRYTKAVLKEGTLFPVLSGELVIDPGLVAVSVEKQEQIRMESYRLKAAPIHIKVHDTGTPSRFLSVLESKNIPVDFGSQKTQIILLMDVSGTMRAIDMPEGSRLDAIRQGASDFIKAGMNAQIGVKIFSSDVKTVLTLSGKPTVDALEAVRYGMMKDGSAIGDAIFDSLKDLSADSACAVVLLTDGAENNAGHLDPATAAVFAKARGVKIYVIQVGKSGLVNFPVDDPELAQKPHQVTIHTDDAMMNEIILITGGKLFKALNSDQIKQAFDLIRVELKI